MYEGEFRPGMVFECDDSLSPGQSRITLRQRTWDDEWKCENGRWTTESHLRKHARLVSAPPVEESIAQPAARPLAEGWERLTAKDHSYFPDGCKCFFCDERGRKGVRSEFKVRTPGGGSRNACEACAERAGVFADVGVADSNSPQVTPSAASAAAPGPTRPAPGGERAGAAGPSCNWTCSREHGTHGPRCGKAQWTRQAVADANAMMARTSIVGEYQPGGDGLRLSLCGEDPTEFHAWAAAQHGLPPEPRPPGPRIRDIYVEGDGADPDYVSGQGVR